MAAATATRRTPQQPTTTGLLRRTSTSLVTLLNPNLHPDPNPHLTLTLALTLMLVLTLMLTLVLTLTLILTRRR